MHPGTQKQVECVRFTYVLLQEVVYHIPLFPSTSQQKANPRVTAAQLRCRNQPYV